MNEETEGLKRVRQVVVGNISVTSSEDSLKTLEKMTDRLVQKHVTGYSKNKKMIGV